MTIPNRTMKMAMNLYSCLEERHRAFGDRRMNLAQLAARFFVFDTHVDRNAADRARVVKGHSESEKGQGQDNRN